MFVLQFRLGRSSMLASTAWQPRSWHLEKHKKDIWKNCKNGRGAMFALRLRRGPSCLAVQAHRQKRPFCLELSHISYLLANGALASGLLTCTSRMPSQLHLSMPLRAAAESLSSPVKHGMFEASKGPTGTRPNAVLLLLLRFLMIVNQN